MALITTLKDNEGNTLYPITSSQAVFDSQGNDLDTRLDNMVEKESGKGLSSNDYTNADKQKLTALPTNEQLTESLNGKQGALADSDDITIDNNKLVVTERAKYASLIRQFIEAGGGFDEESQLGSLNGITDLSYGDMAVILEAGRLRNADAESFYANNARLRTNLEPVYGWNMCNLTHTCWNCTSLEVFNAYRCIIATYAFAHCNNLHTIIGTIYNNGGSLTNAFSSCGKLKSLCMKLVAKATSFSLSDSPLIDLASFQYMIANAENTSPITITVHADVYAKLTGDTESEAFNELSDEEKEQWQGLVTSALEKNIAFATV